MKSHERSYTIQTEVTYSLIKVAKLRYERSNIDFANVRIEL